MITPNTNIKLLKTPFELDNLNQLTFTSLQNQTTFFNTLPSVDLENATFQRKDNRIRFETNEEFTFDDVLKYNYCMYQNTSYGDKWFYAFITNVEYKNDGMSELEIKTDVFQTYQFEMLWHPSFIEREHIAKADDTYHSNLIEENINFKEYYNILKNDYSIGNSHPVMATTVSPIDASNVGNGLYGGVYSGCKYYIFDSNTTLNNSLITIANAGKSSGIVSLFIAPDWLTGYTNATFTNGVAEVPITQEETIQGGFAIPLNPSVIGNYTPKNKKIFNYPWCYYTLSNNSGSEIILKLEDFKDDGTHTGSIDIIGTITPGCSIRAIPVNYEVGHPTFAEGQNNQYGLNLGKFPICSFPVDSYINWLTQNSVNIPISLASGAISTATGIMTGNAVGVAGGAISIAQTIGSIYEHSLIPPSVNGNTNSGDVTYASDKLTFTGYLKTIKEPEARILDDYFSMYGYASHLVKLPNLRNRSNWNYVKTIGANITGDIPQKDLQEIKELFNNGVTLWHNPTTFLDYGQNNN